jgi:hypothetical protein
MGTGWVGRAAALSLTPIIVMALLFVGLVP